MFTSNHTSPYCLFAADEDTPRSVVKQRPKGSTWIMDYIDNETFLDDWSYFYYYYSYDYDQGRHDPGCYRSLVRLAASVSSASVGLPSVFITIFALNSLTKTDEAAPVYIINLLISDIIQLCFMIIKALPWDIDLCFAISYIQYYGVMVSICFMVVISLERYLLINQPVWYTFIGNVRTSRIVCVGIWFLPLLDLPIYFHAGDHGNFIRALMMLIPVPLFIFFLFETLKTLNRPCSIPTDEKQRIVVFLGLVLIIYVIIFFPYIVFCLSQSSNQQFEDAVFILLYLNPWTDFLMCVSIRKKLCDKLLAFLCCKRGHQDSNPTLENDTQSSNQMQTV
ncbi:mas-related G-protein coupled receptor member B5-like isoform X1 [Oryzias melastigma]|uniref:mas-related G-protein coupled receptor member B5-like isoform X1 n=1 Tax=Oryzias melastigma TaxID=30732 RepID=UPI00168D57CB|nr:mas-related G-protein coupled receptor member B5-like isoform X1 [Oryzias melastigma]